MSNAGAIKQDFGLCFYLADFTCFFDTQNRFWWALAGWKVPKIVTSLEFFSDEVLESDGQVVV